MHWANGLLRRSGFRVENIDAVLRAASQPAYVATRGQPLGSTTPRFASQTSAPRGRESGECDETVSRHCDKSGRTRVTDPSVKTFRRALNQAGCVKKFGRWLPRCVSTPGELQNVMGAEVPTQVLQWPDVAFPPGHPMQAPDGPLRRRGPHPVSAIGVPNGLPPARPKVWLLHCHTANGVERHYT